MATNKKGEEIVWMRAEDGDPQERPFTKEHAEALLEYQKQHNLKDWRVIPNPKEETADGTPNNS